MVQGLFIFIYSVNFISVLCSLSVTAKLYINEKIYLISALAAGTAIIELTVLSSIIWINNFEENVPRVFCIFQGIIIQYGAYLQITAALCFSIHVYQLLVRRGKVTRSLRSIYIGSIIMVPILMTIVVAIISIKTNAIRPFALACDIRSPTWVRLIGYSGFDFILTFVGVYFSVRASYELFKHLDQFKSQISETSSNNKNDTPNLQVYSVTKAAAIRMVLFSIGFALINISATVQSIYLIMKGKDDKFYGGLRGPDFAVAFTGIIIYLIFGLPRMFTKYD